MSNIYRNRTVFLLVIAFSFWGAHRGHSQTVVIRQIEFDITGCTKARAVKNYLQIEEGMRFESGEQLQAYIDEKEQQLENSRVFRTATIRYGPITHDKRVSYYTLLNPYKCRYAGEVYYPVDDTKTDDGKTEENPTEEIPVQVLITIQDGWTLFPIPIYQYNSSVGHTFLGVFWDRNFFGTMSSIKLRTLLHRETLDIDLIAEKIRVFQLPWRIIAGYEYLEQIKLENNEVALHFDKKTLELGLGTELPLGHNFLYSFFPSAEYRFDYHILEGGPDKSFEPEGISLLYTHYLGYDSIDWKRNFRTGIYGKLEHTIGFTPANQKLINKVLPEFIAHLTAGPFGFGMRITGFYWNGVERTGAGEELRGVIDNTLWGDGGGYINTDVGLRILTIKKVMEFHLKGFFDVGVVKPAEAVLHSDQLEYTAGLGILFYPLIAPGMVIRLGYGFDLKRPGNGEFTFSFEEFY